MDSFWRVIVRTLAFTLRKGQIHSKLLEKLRLCPVYSEVPIAPSIQCNLACVWGPCWPEGAHSENPVLERIGMNVDGTVRVNDVSCRK